MAKTQGHGNPSWTRDETILALELYFSTAGRLRSRDERVEELSKTLRSLPYHTAAARRATFRNPAGVAFKVQNLRQVATGVGLGNVSEMDRNIWLEFGDSREEVARLARLIRNGLEAIKGEDTAETPVVEDEFYEGGVLTRLHFVRERNPRVRKALIASRSASDLCCDICLEKHEHVRAEWRNAGFEAHHVVPISQAGAGTTKLKDLALLCANCHRFLHRAIAVKKRWISIVEAKSLLTIPD